ncbi:MAG: DnaJ domain-containing protein [Limisphaerales bacterium]
MTDYFDLLNEPRRPWLDSDLLKQKFLSLSAKAHPDKVHPANESEKQAASKTFAELNAAYHCLALPKLRLLHLMQLERGTKPGDIQQIPPPVADLFTQVAAICRDADRFLAEKAKIISPLLQVQRFERGQEWLDTLNTFQKKLGVFQDELLVKLKSLDAQWTADGSNRAELLNGLESLYRLFSYLNRWSAQIQERLVQLSI